MKNLSYLFLIASVAFGLAGCADKDDDNGVKTPDKVELSVRSISVEEGATVLSLDEVTVDFNNLIAVDGSKAATLNGQPIQAAVNPGNGMQLVLPVVTEVNKNYTLVIPDGLVHLRDNASVTYGGMTLTFNTNYGVDKSNIDTSLTNKNATAEASNLYKQMLADYGEVMYSGAMGGVAWELDYSNFVNENNGGAGYPKVVGFDYIHLAYSPANWINYGDITPVKTIWDAGSIPTITWHWNVPDDPSDPNNNTFNATKFSPLKALTPGTPENIVINADIEKLAGYMKLLQDARIPVLFRPFHEAAGDYGWGPWFWWGKDGVDATKQLWKYLRDKLEGEYGINNLIWVWTVQTSEYGKMASLETIRNAYPGNDLVDMVGTDLYPDNALTDQTDQFNMVNKVADCRKIVCLSEVGNLIDPEAAAAKQALWSYFMNWYDTTNADNAPLTFGFKMWNSKPVKFGETTYPNAWAAVANNRFVKNR